MRECGERVGVDHVGVRAEEGDGGGANLGDWEASLSLGELVWIDVKEDLGVVSGRGVEEARGGRVASKDAVGDGEAFEFASGELTMSGVDDVFV